MDQSQINTSNQIQDLRIKSESKSINNQEEQQYKTWNQNVISKTNNMLNEYTQDAIDNSNIFDNIDNIGGGCPNNLYDENKTNDENLLNFLTINNLSSSKKNQDLAGNCWVYDNISLKDLEKIKKRLDKMYNQLIKQNPKIDCSNDEKCMLVVNAMQSVDANIRYKKKTKKEKYGILDSSENSPIQEGGVLKIQSMTGATIVDNILINNLESNKNNPNKNNEWIVTKISLEKLREIENKLNEYKNLNTRVGKDTTYINTAINIISGEIKIKDSKKQPKKTKSAREKYLKYKMKYLELKTQLGL